MMAKAVTVLQFGNEHHSRNGVFPKCTTFGEMAQMYPTVRKSPLIHQHAGGFKDFSCFYR